MPFPVDDMRTVTDEFTAFMEDPDADKPNPIHSTETAREHGFRGALVGGATAFGWTARTIIAALGPEWLDNGWVHLKFVNPIYPDDPLRFEVERAQEDGCSLSVKRDSDVCILGEVGIGRAPWFGLLSTPEFRPGVAVADTLPVLTLDNAPVGGRFQPMAVPLSIEAARTFALEREREILEVLLGDSPRVHPAWIAEQLIHMLHHSYDYGPSIHAQSHIQHLKPAFAGQTFSVTADCREVYERKGHHYIVNDGAIWSESGDELVRLRHTSVFRIAKR
ncbi:MAG: MaoC/PaaZ C-terminal domain-containing protein [Gammaproteobacteria bacterium]|nr:MaoC/PaaZ C-terminal domain-containing protein [Gammaproteobacteria bacterium]